MSEAHELDQSIAEDTLTRRYHVMQHEALTSMEREKQARIKQLQVRKGGCMHSTHVCSACAMHMGMHVSCAYLCA